LLAAHFDTLGGVDAAKTLDQRDAPRTECWPEWPVQTIAWAQLYEDFGAALADARSRFTYTGARESLMSLAERLREARQRFAADAAGGLLEQLLTVTRWMWEQLRCLPDSGRAADRFRTALAEAQKEFEAHVQPPWERFVEASCMGVDKCVAALALACQQAQAGNLPTPQDRDAALRAKAMYQAWQEYDHAMNAAGDELDAA